MRSTSNQQLPSALSSPSPVQSAPSIAPLSRHQCRVCRKLFLYPSELRRHEISHSDERPFQCDKCPKTFKWKNQLQKHLQKHQQNKHPAPSPASQPRSPSFSCSLCQNAFRSQSVLIIHQLRVHSGFDVSLTFEQCDRSFHRVEALQRHLRESHDNGGEVRLHSRRPTASQSSAAPTRASRPITTMDCVNEEMSSSFQCEFCEKVFDRQINLKRHFTIAHVGVDVPEVVTRIQCQLCQKYLSRRQVLKSHLSKVHSMDESEVRDYMLSNFGKSRRGRKKRRVVSTNSSQSVDEGCGKITPIASTKVRRYSRPFRHDKDENRNQNDNVSLHLLDPGLLSSNDCFECEYCPRTFPSNLLLSEHLRGSHRLDPQSLKPIVHDALHSVNNAPPKYDYYASDTTSDFSSNVASS